MRLANRHLNKHLFVSVLLLAAVVASCHSSPPAGDRPRAFYDPATRRLSRLEFDLNKDGKNDTVSYMEGTRINRVELDVDQNGRVDRWDFYTPDGSLDHIGWATGAAGTMDSEAFYSPQGALDRIEVSTKHDGRFDRTEFYRDNVLIRSQDDTNGDGRPDKWDDYAPYPNHQRGEPAYRITVTGFDDTGAGRPDRRFVWAADGTVARVERDPGATGHWAPQAAAAPHLSAHK
jgi:hypothetical protein